ncbi:AAA family ATPase [Cypionkella sp.]|uniref:AAA family ATPase n=1 Tax=Cypionkella sp. TaxID=2811411 RepID=UPI002721444F|nr:AAA family ATPase [Cypionkella sp.]MDO8985950.1 AAA family ATPase [Cypionkella sp.]MDP2048139.1 AAA family ATPase [Cypionkella sp.]
MTLTSVDKEPVASWPLGDGALPVSLFADEHLRIAIFEYLPIFYKCAAATIRQGLKVHLKRTVPSELRLAGADLTTRDQVMSSLFANRPAARDRASEINFSYEESYKQRGRIEKRERPLPPVASFALLMWKAYLKAPEMAEMHGWLIGFGIPMEVLGDGVFLTSEGLARAVTDVTCPVEVESLWLARSIVLFAALLPKDERYLLLKTAKEFGCSPIAEAYFPEIGAGVSGVDSRETKYDVITSPRLRRPRLLPPISVEIGSKSASPDVARQIEALKAAELAMMNCRLSAELALRIDPAIAIDGPSESWDVVTKAVADARDSAALFAELHTARIDQRNCVIYGLEAKFGLLFTADCPEMGGSTDSLVVSLGELDALSMALDTLDPASPIFTTLRRNLVSPLTTEMLWDLVLLAHRDALAANARATFQDEVATYCVIASTAEIAAFLAGIDCQELRALLPGLIEPPWNVAGAILLRATLDVCGAGQSEMVAWILSVPHDFRRTLLRFVDPTSSLFDVEHGVRRLIAVERLRDIFEFGPLAQISDPASGLSDVELVGRSVHGLIELVVSNLDILTSGADIVRALRVPIQKAEACECLIRFIHAPVTLNGNFRRLRERARELLLVPLLDSDRPNVQRAAQLSTAIASGQSLEDVIASFESERPDERLEARHREQLSRYLHQAGLVLHDFLSEANERPNARRRSFMATLREIRNKLRSVGEVGTVEWLEIEVAAMLDGEEYAYENMTLIGDTTPISTRAWNSSDREWASSFLDLPEFHVDLSPTSFELAASVLHWKSVGSVPTTRDIVCYLIDRQFFCQALRVANDVGDEIAKDLVRNAAAPAVRALTARAEGLLKCNNQARHCSPFDYGEFDTALASLDIEAAEEILDKRQHYLNQDEGIYVADTLDTPTNALRIKLIDCLRRAGFNAADDEISIVELEAMWADVMAMRDKERSHLIAVSSALEKYATMHPELASKLVDFIEASQDPSCWLHEAVSANFKTLVQETTPKLVNWVINSPSFRNEERAALVALTTWYCDFVLERSLSLHNEDDKDVIQSGVDRILEVAVIVAEAQKPTDCLAQLAESGESEALFPSIYDASAAAENTDHELSGTSKPSLSDGHLGSSASMTADSPLPEALLGALRTNDWRTAVDVCESIARGANAVEADRLRLIGHAIEALLDEQALPPTDRADTFPSSASWLFGQGDGAQYINESSRMELAFRLLTGAVASDSGQEMPRAPDLGGSWSELLGRASPFRRMLSVGLPSRTGRVLEALISGMIGLPVAERLWDAATNLSEPQNYRTPLLNLLSDHGAHEVIIKLAQRYEPAIAPRLAQLFELRAVAQNRPDLLPVAQSVAEDVAGHARGAPFRAFVKGLPSAAQVVKPKLYVTVDGSVQLRPFSDGTSEIEVPIIVTPEGLVPTKLFAKLFVEDDLTFADGSRLKELSRKPIYFATDFAVGISFGRSWFEADAVHRDTVRIRIEAKTVTDELVQEDAVCTIRPLDRAKTGRHRLDTETLLELYPGVANNPVVDKSFVGRIDELERLHQVLVASKNPSPVLLTGMRRVGKTSLLYAFHKRYSLGRNNGAISIYQSLAERKVELVSLDHTVASVFFRAITHGLVRPNLPAEDRNYALCAIIRQRFNNDWKAARSAIQECYDEESLSSSLMILSERLREWTGSNSRFIFLIDEAEALVAPYQAGGRKKIELEQFLQSLREVSQTTGSIGLLLSGSNHINVFAREYKNAFFGSSQAIELEGFNDVSTASKIVTPGGVERFVQFEASAVEYAWTLCAGMPQFLWQVGATTAFQVRTGSATRSDIRAAVGMLVGPERIKLPYKPYEILEPIDNILSLETPKERDLLWMLLYRVAQASSLAAQDAAIPFVIDQSLLGADDQAGWRRRIRGLVDLKVLRMESAAAVRFQVPLFAEGFRAPKNWQEFNVRQQQVGL